MGYTMIDQYGRKFVGPTQKMLCSTSYAFLWKTNDSDLEKPLVISPFKWTIEVALTEAILSDPNGETRIIPVGGYHRAIEFRSWAAFDLAYRKELEKELKNVKGELERVVEELARANEIIRNDRQDKLSLLEQIYDINEQGGPGSRKAVRTLLYRAGVQLCNHGKAGFCHSCQE